MAAEKDIFATLGELLAELGHAFGEEAPGRDVTIGQLEMDSLELLEFMMLIEEHLGVEVEVEQLTAETTLGEVETLIRNSVV